MHKAVTILMLKLECQVIDRNPDFKMQERDFLRRIDVYKRQLYGTQEREPLDVRWAMACMDLEDRVAGLDLAPVPVSYTHLLL